MTGRWAKHLRTATKALDAHPPRQMLMINQTIAGRMAIYLYRLLTGRDLDVMVTYIDLTSGSTRSVGINKPTDEEE